MKTALIELEALKVEAIAMLADNVGRLVDSGRCQPYGYEQVAEIATRIRELTGITDLDSPAHPDPVPEVTR